MPYRSGWLLEGLEVLQQRGSPLSTILDALPVGIVVADEATSRLLFVNTEALRILELGADQVRDCTVERFFRLLAFRHLDGSAYAHEQRPLQRALNGELVRHEVVLVTPGETPRTLVVTACPLRDTSGAVLGAMALWQDISAARATTEIAAVALRSDEPEPAGPDLSARSLNCAITQEGTSLTLSVRGEIDLANAQIFRLYAAQALTRGEGHEIVFDLRGTTYLDGSGLRILEEVVRRNGAIVIFPSPVIRKVLELIGLGPFLRE